MQYARQFEHEPTPYADQENISITLHNQDLWKRFHEITNEMIVTKVGRRMFPIIAISIRGLDPDKMYTIELSFDQLDAHRWRYAGSEWQPGMKPDPVIYRAPYQHPDSPNYGRTWMKEVISFPKVKLTNKVDHTSASQVVLNSLHKYRPRISIIDVMLKEKIYEISFNETEFIAVTAYQNEEVKALKIRHNPFAKAFLDTSNIQEQATNEDGNNALKFYSQESSSGGPDRLKIQSYRSSPYCYSSSQRKSSPKPIHPYPSSSNSPFDLSTFYPPIPDTNVSCSSSLSPSLPDNTVHYSNSYYASPSTYYFPYGAPSVPPANHYPFISPFSYSLNKDANQDTGSFLYMQTPMSGATSEDYCFNSLQPVKSDLEQY